MANPWYLASAFATMGLLWLMAIALLAFRCPSRANRPFAAYLFLHGAMVGANALYRSPVGVQAFWEAVYYDLRLLLVPVLLYFCLQFVRFDKPAVRATLSAGVLVAAAAIQLWHVADPCADICTVEGGRQTGPLFLLDYAMHFWFSLLALGLVAATWMSRPAKRAAVALVAGGLALLALLNGLLAIGQVTQAGLHLSGVQDSLWTTSALLLKAGTVVPALLTLGLVVVAAGPSPEVVRRAALASGAVAAVVLTSLVIVSTRPPQPDTPTLAILLTHLWSLLYAALIAYALLRHRLFGLEQAVKFTLSRSTIVAIFLAMFFIVSKIVEAVAQKAFEEDGQAWGTVIGAAAAGLLLFALHPLERLGERVADTVLPGHRAADRNAKLRHYRAQVELVWSDGIMGLRERTLLERLRERLGVLPEDALRIEHEAAQQVDVRSPSRKRRGAKPAL